MSIHIFTGKKTWKVLFLKSPKQEAGGDAQNNALPNLQEEKFTKFETIQNVSFQNFMNDQDHCQALSFVSVLFSLYVSM